MLCTIVERTVSVYPILQFLHSELGHFEAGESRWIEKNRGDRNFLLYLTPFADLWSLENFQLLQKICNCSFLITKLPSDITTKVQEKLTALKSR